MFITKENEKTHFLHQAAAFLAASAGGFVLAETELAGTPSFAGISLAGALALPQSAAVLAGSILRYVLSGTVPESIIQISAMIIILIYKLIFDSAQDAKYSGISTGAAVLTAGAAVSALIGELLYKLVFYIFYGALAGVTAYAIALIAASLRHQLVLDLSSTDRKSVV